MENGCVKQYLADHNEINRAGLQVGIAQGLEYLHTFSPQIIHGDLKAENVLVDKIGRPCLIDFGLSRMLDDSTLWATTASTAPGTVRWKAPELLSCEQTTVTVEGDIYALAMTCLEVVTGELPFSQYRNDSAIILAVVMKKERPTRPENDLIRDALWGLWTKCWTDNPADRPMIASVVQTLVDYDKVDN